MESSFDAVYLLQAVRDQSGEIVDFQFVDLNERGAQLISRDRKSLIDQRLCELFPTNCTSGFFHKYKSVVETATPLEEELSAEAIPGVTVQWLRHQVVPVGDGIVIISQDMTERKQSEMAIADREKLYRTLTENSPDVIARVDRHLRHLYVNPAVTKATGLAPEAFIGKSHAEMAGMPPELTQFWQSKLNQVFETGQPSFYEFQFPAPDGTRYYLSRVIPEWDANGGVESLLGITSDITDLKLAEQSVRQNEARLRRIVESSMIGLGFWDLEGNIWEANDALLTLLGYTQEEVCHQKLNWKTLTPHQYRAVDQQALQEIAEQGFCTPFEKEYFRKDGSCVPVLCGGAAFENCHDNGVFFILDLTERKKMEAECEHLLKLERAAREEAEASNRIKNEFLTVISHELRTPLNPILGCTQLLQSRPFEAEPAAKVLQVIERNAQLQVQLVEDLLDISQILQGGLTLNYYAVNVVETVEMAIASVRLSAEAKLIRLHATLNDGTDQVLGNQARIQQIVWNLLSNAIKFTPAEGRVEINVEPVGGFVQIRVSDTGKGIEPDFLPFVFDYFRQSDSSITRQFGGLGLGLAISRHLVELHGGTIEAASPGVEQGATFTVRLPRLQSEAEQHSSRRTAAMAWEGNRSAEQLLDEALTGFHVLVVGVAADLQQCLTLALKQAGARVTSVDSVRDALQVLVNHQPDVLISDMEMPDEDGYSLMEQIRLLEPELFNTVPAIALTTPTNTADPAQTLAAGYQRQINKPVQPEELIFTVAALAQSSIALLRN